MTGTHSEGRIVFRTAPNTTIAQYRVTSWFGRGVIQSTSGSRNRRWPAGRRSVVHWFAALKGPVKDRLTRYGIADRFADRHFPTVGTAVTAYLEQAGTPYADWTDQEP